MPYKLIPLELHLTVQKIEGERLDEFSRWCLLQGAKPIIIELGSGASRQQPMLGKVIHGSGLTEALAAGRALSAALKRDGFETKRVKIEIPADCAGLADVGSGTFGPYFEWHAKVSCSNTEALLAVARQHGGHLSRNAISGEQYARFITLREYGTRERFNQRIDALLAALAEGEWSILKIESEYCIYDSNISLDRGWLPQ